MVDNFTKIHKISNNMSTEIELKAHVKDYKALKALLSKKADYSGAFEKDDTLWFPGDTRYLAGESLLHPYGLRIRREKRSFPDGSAESKCFATHKIKEVRDGIEINDEREFEVNPGSAFEDFLRRMGLKPGLSKRKRGWAFSLNEINAELVEVEGLGWFVELEIVTENNLAEGKSEKIVAEAREKLLEFLDGLGINRDAIESRFYSEMLRKV